MSVFFFVWQVGIYVLEAGLGMPEFLSEGNSRLKKANQLMQKLLEYFYDFVIPGGCPVQFGVPRQYELPIILIFPLPSLRRGRRE